MTDLTQAGLMAVLRYDPEAGLFYWNHSAGRHGRIPAGAVAGRLHPEGYRYIHIRGKQYRAARLAHLYMTGEWPPEQMDHRNRNPSDDRWSNLRPATGSQNKANSSIYRNNTTGLTGVYWCPERPATPWRAKTKVDGKRKWLGRFATKEAAHAAFLAASQKQFGEYAASSLSENST